MIDQIENGEGGGSVRAKINASIDVSNLFIGVSEKVVAYDTEVFSNLSSQFGYQLSGRSKIVSPGDMIRVIGIGSAYQVADPSASDASLDYTGSGGVKLYVLAAAGGASLFAFGAVGDGVTDDSAIITAALNTSPQSIHTFNGTFYTPSQIQLTASRLNAGGFNGVLKTDQKSSMIASIPASNAQRITAAFSQIIGLGFEQPYFGGSGTDNNHAVASFSGISPAVVATYGDVDITPAFGYGPATADRNSWGGVYALNRYIVKHLGFQTFSGYTAVVGNTHLGDQDGAGTLAQSIGFRFTGYTTSGISPNVGSVSAANVVRNMRLPLSIQNATSMGNHVAGHATGGEIGVQFTPVSTEDAAVQRGNIVSWTLKDVERPIYSEGAEGNIIELSVDGTQQPGEIRASGAGEFGSGKHNWIRGIIRNASTVGDRAMNIVAPDTRVDLTIVNSGSRGIVISGARCTGTLIVDTTASFPIVISGSNCNLTITVLNSGTTHDITVSGSNNVLRVQSAGNISCTGTGNVFSGKVAGTITGRVGNNFSGVDGEIVRGRTSVTTNSVGRFTIAYTGSNNIVIDASVIASFSGGGVLGMLYLVSMSGGLATFEARNTAGATINSTSLSVGYRIERYGD